MKKLLILISIFISSSLFCQNFVAQNEDTIITNYTSDGNVAKITTIGKLLFNFNESNLNKESEMLLNTIIMVLLDNPTMTICINSYNETSETTQKISEKRATTTKNYLMKKGISSKRLKLKDFGNSKQLSEQNASELNRRVEFTFE